MFSTRWATHKSNIRLNRTEGSQRLKVIDDLNTIIFEKVNKINGSMNEPWATFCLEYIESISNGVQ
jgi:hypothetical protein